MSKYLISIIFTIVFAATAHATTPPNSPQQLTPTHNAIWSDSQALPPGNITFTWKDNGDAENNPLWFYFYLIKWNSALKKWEAHTTSYASAQGITTYTLSLTTGYYAWQVAAVDGTKSSDPWHAWADLNGDNQVTVADWSFVVVKGNSASVQAKIKEYRASFDKIYEANKGHFNGMVSNPSGDYSGAGTQDVYYYVQYLLDGTITMYEATRDEIYLDRALTWVETMMSKATIIDIHGNKNWPGTYTSGYTSTPSMHLLYEFQAGTAVAHIARVAMIDPNVPTKYRSRGKAIRDFMRDNVVDKWVFDRNNYAWHLNIAKDTSKVMSDKTMMLVRMMNDLSLTGETKYDSKIIELAKLAKARMEPYQGGLIYDYGLPNSSNKEVLAPDTSHANRFPYMVLDLYKSGKVFTLEDVKGLGILLTDVMWDQSLTSPKFTNYIDGTNTIFRKREAWFNGAVEYGWLSLGQVDPDVQQAGDAVFQALEAGKTNPSLGYMSRHFSRMELAGHLAKNLSISGF